MKSIFVNQLGVLLWKNFRLRKRKPIQLTLEILIPLVIIFILVRVRHVELKFRMDRCLLKEKQTASMGPVPFIRDFLCTFNTTCYNKTQIDWGGFKPNDFLSFLTEFNSIYNSLPNENLNYFTIKKWLEKNSKEIEKLIIQFNKMSNDSEVLLKAAKQLQSQNESIFEEGFQTMSEFFCGSKENDLRIFSNFNRNHRPKRSIETCEMKFFQFIGNGTFGWRIYELVAPLIFGKVFYTPDTNFTRQLISRSNSTFKTLDDLRLAAVLWRISFREKFENALTNGTRVSRIRSLIPLCIKLSPQYAQVCRQINSTFTVSNVRSFTASVSTIFSLIENVLNCTRLDKFVPLVSLSDVNNLVNESLENMLAAVVFNVDNPTLLRYEIRMPTNRIDTTKRFKVLDAFWTPTPRRNTMSDLKYYTSGFLLLQEAIDQAFIEMVAGENGLSNVGTSMQIMPYPCFVKDRFIIVISNLMPLILVVSWSMSFTVIIKSIVYEKENRLKEFMRVMGLTNLVHWLSWFISTIVILICPVLIMTILLKYQQILEFSSPGVVFVVLFSYVVSFISQAFMISVFFDNANMASVSGGILYVVFYLPFLVFIHLQDFVTVELYYLGGLFSQVAFANAINFIAYWEQSTDGANFSNFFESSITNLDFGVGHCVVMLWVDSLLYLLITWYVEAIFPGQYGVAKPWYFPVTKRYWCSSYLNNGSNEIILKEIRNSESPKSETSNHNGFEIEPVDLKIGISIRNLVKTYGSSKIPAVNNLNLNFYQSQITSFLGHNGAGKTTTISILTGIVSPTSGTAFVLNEDIRIDMDKIRKHMGLCPQHNILFGNLTVEDHIYFYGMLKGLSGDEIKRDLQKIVKDVGLAEKIHSITQNLSGGMKRKLSVAMAFIGESEIVFLDEPTAGVDPFARRGIWDLLIKYRRTNRTIILTTHHMDEADYLSDRIAIISQGKLKCCGSSVFLKKEFGDGYYLILAKNAVAQNEDFHRTGLSTSGRRILEFINDHIEDARMVKETGSQWKIVLPQTEVNSQKFASLFEELDKSMERFNITTYGLSDASLQDVFLKIADDPAGVAECFTDNQIELDNLNTAGDDVNLLKLDNVLDFPCNEDRLEINGYTYVPPTPRTSNLFEGFSLLRQQMIALQIKRFHHTKRNFKGFLAELFLPVLMILLMILLLKVSNPLENQPSMVISPWLMMPKYRYSNLHTFYRKENISNPSIDRLVEKFRTDLGESGVRCMNRAVYHLPHMKCYPASNNKWSPLPAHISLVTPECNCNKTGYEQCFDKRSGGPPESFREMSSSDILSNLTGYNLTDYLIKNYRRLAKTQYGGYQMLLPSYFGLSMNLIGRLGFWDNIRELINKSDSESMEFLDHIQNFIVLSGKKTNYSRIWVNTKGYASMPAYANIFSNLLLRTQLNSSKNASNYGIVVSNYPLKYSQSDLMELFVKQMILDITLAVFVIFGLSLIPASFVIFLIEERVSGSKRQQFVSGINPYVYWLSNFLWDIFKYVIPVCIVFLIFVLFNYQSYIGSKNVVAFILLLIFYGLAIIPHMYLFSFIISTPSTAFVVLSAYNHLVGAVTTIVTSFLDLLQQSDPTLGQINNALKMLFLLFPQYDLGRGMMELSLNYLEYNITRGESNYDPLAWKITGEKLTSLIILFVGWWVVLLIVESGIINRSLFGKIKNYRLKYREMAQDEDQDVYNERERINAGGDNNDFDVLKIVNLTKIYNPFINCKSNLLKKCLKKTVSKEKRALAVNNVCFGVKEGECFGLLGVNGAGKTTIFKMLTGEENITRGNALINGNSIIHDMISAHKNMGFCPQFDALHSLLTCEEELYFYCRIRGVKPMDIQSVVELSLKDLSLTPHANKPTNTLSGGNKRKLSTAISLIGYPKIIFLDEPTTGMDAGAKQFLWNIIQKLTTENKISVILTSHNMEECEILCHRLAIMVNGMIKCIGSVQHLKSKFGDDYYVRIRILFAEDLLADRMKLKSMIADRFPIDVSLKDETFVTLEYRFSASSAKLSVIFEFFEKLKKLGSIVDYSVSQTSLDDIFINFAKDKQVPEIVTDADVVVDQSGLITEVHVNDTYEVASVNSDAIS